MKLVHVVGTVGILASTGWLAAVGCGGEDSDVFGNSGTGATGAGANGTGASGANGTGANGTGASGTGASGTGGSGTGGNGTAGAGGHTVVCGDFVCDPSECGSCPPDCGINCAAGCGNGTCDANEDCTSCPADCQTGCGDGCCLLGEDCQSCAQDCKTVEGCDPGACGNGVCNYGLSETCLNCADCFGLCDCGDDVCAAPETAANCPWDCGG